ncbi:MAG: Crp/Fnr family transcriptional regulator [Pseudomonadota bacterium]
MNSTIDQALPSAAREALDACTRTRRYGRGEAVVRVNDASRDLYRVMSGSVRVSLIASTGRSITFQVLTAGAMFGEVAAIDGSPRTADVIAEGPCRIGCISAADVQGLCRDHPEFAFMLLRKLAALNRRLTQKVFEYHTYDVRGRVCLELLRLWQERSAGPLTITDRDMASRVGTTRENVSRIHAELRQQGLLDRSKSEINDMDTDGLTRLLADCEFH